MSNWFKDFTSTVAAGAIVGGLTLAITHGSAEAREPEEDDTAIKSDPSPNLRQNWRRLAINKNGMLTLIGWAIGNMGLGAYGMGTSSGEAKYFHQMNLMWNSVNAIIGGFGYYSAATEDVSGLNEVETLEKTHAMQQILLFNAGLDIAYSVGGVGLRVLGDEKRNPQFRGYGNSLILQGGFLFAFDLVLWALHEDALSDYKVSLGPTLPEGPGLSISGSF